jgi:tetratricopeptide (TPR) repeat protein
LATDVRRAAPDFDSLEPALALHAAAVSTLHAGRFEDSRRLAAHAVEAAAAAFGPQSPDMANVLLTAARVEEAMGAIAAALALANNAAQIALPLADTDDPGLMPLWVDIEIECAQLLLTLGNFDEAEARLSAAWRTAQRLLPAQDPCMIAIANVRGITAE